MILIVIPQNRFCDQQLLDLKAVFAEKRVKTVVLSKSGREAVGEMKTRLMPDGILVDWDKRFLSNKKYDAVVVVGGKGAKSSIWNDPILPQILTDHFRAGKVVGALGLSVVALARAGLLSGQDVSIPNHEAGIEELKDAGAHVVEEPLTYSDQIVTAGDDTNGRLFGTKILELLGFT
ncbi:MAG: DJ-1/PfpI family protein [Nitrospinaceae bacterium]|nr:DJ-1/PfpI family protein [Nitrospinaceae bacterium]